MGPGPVDITRLNPHDPPPEALFNRLLDEGRVLPCEHYGPYNAEKFHNNTTGRYRGYCDEATFDADQARYEASVAKQTSWADIDTSIKDFNAEYLFFYGKINGGGLDMRHLRPKVKEAQDAMRDTYSTAMDEARHQVGGEDAYVALSTSPQFSEDTFKARHRGRDGGKVEHRNVDDIRSLCGGALRALPRLWALSCKVRDAGGGHGAAMTWGLKKTRRIWYKVSSKYKGKFASVTDCARTSIVFDGLPALREATNHLLAHPLTVGYKNRIAHPTPELYSDMLFTVSIDGYVCEIQLHVAVIFNAKKGGAGHTMYKLCRLVLQAPIVSVDTYTGGYDNGGRRHGQGRMVYASGDVYEGGWKAGVKEGHGTCRYASGNVYEGEFKADVFEGHGTLRFADGNVYEGEFKAGVREGHGTYRSATGDVYEGEWKADVYEGHGTFRYATREDVYEGEWKAGVREGHGTYRFANGRVKVGRYEMNADVGEGVRWSTDRQKAWRLQNGAVAQEISLDEARQIAERVGEAVPA